MLIPINKRTDMSRAMAEAWGKQLRGDPNDSHGLKVMASEGSKEATLMVYDLIGWPFNDPHDFTSRVMSLPVDLINVMLHSPGGNVFDAISMMATLKMHPAKVVVQIMGVAASAATLLMLGADEIRMVSGAMVMVHKPWMFTAGNDDELMEDVEFLRKMSGEMVALYEKRTGQSAEQIESWMKATTYFTAQEAKDSGFIDTITDGEAKATIFNLSAYGEVPEILQSPKDSVPIIEPVFDRSRNMRRLALAELCG